MNTAKSIPALKCLPVDEITIARADAVVVDLADDLGQLHPEGGNHGVHRIGPVQPDVRDLVRDLYIETLVSHSTLE